MKQTISVTFNCSDVGSQRSVKVLPVGFGKSKLAGKSNTKRYSHKIRPLSPRNTTQYLMAQKNKKGKEENVNLYQYSCTEAQLLSEFSVDTFGSNLSTFSIMTN